MLNFIVFKIIIIIIFPITSIPPFLSPTREWGVNRKVERIS